MEKRLFKEGLQVPYTISTQKYKTGEGWVEVDPFRIYPGYPEYNAEFIENSIFREHLTFTHFSRGRSSVKAHFDSYMTGNQYEMFISDMEELINLEYQMTSLDGFFCFRKQGKNFGITLLHDVETVDDI